jgi:hypothetical protein
MLSLQSPPATGGALRCVVCQHPFDFAAGQSATVLRHVAYGYDFAHPGACHQAALEWLFPEPGYDCAAFSTSRDHVRVVHAWQADGCWALVEQADGGRRLVAIVRDAEWQDEPGGAELAPLQARPWGAALAA